MNHNILIKIKNFVFNKIRGYKEGQKYKKQARNTLELRKSKLTDYERWKQTEELYVDWNQRTAILASMISPGANIIEFGAGNMALKNFLPSGCQYTPSDIVQRNLNFIKCDLNETIPFDLSTYTTAVFSGVFEYVYDVDKVFLQLSDSLDIVLLSYACSDISTANRLNSGWLSDYSKKELEEIFEKYDFQIVEYKEWRNQSLFSLRKSLVK